VFQNHVELLELCLQLRLFFFSPTQIGKDASVGLSR
jgi:hypothetical protein